MAVGLSVYQANRLLDCYNNGSAAVAATYIKMHIGSPGAAGTSNPAVETTRKIVSFAAAASGAISNDATVRWSAVAASEDYTFFSLWDAPTGGNFLQSGTIVAAPAVVGDPYEIPAGLLDLTFTSLAA